MKNRSIILLLFILTLTTLFAAGCGKGSPLSPSESVSGTSGAPDSTPESTQENTGDTSFRMVQNPWSWGSGSVKNIPDCDLGKQIFGILGKLKETGKTDPKINDDKEFNEISVMAAPRGTLWLDCGQAGLFRIAPDFSQICRVDAAMGEGKILENNEELVTLLKQAWFYYPHDCWSGKYENGEATLVHVYEVSTAIDSVEIKEIKLPENPDTGRIALVVTANKDFEGYISLECRQSDDNLGLGDGKTVSLKAGQPEEIELSFTGFNFNYYLNVLVDNTRVEITIVPPKSP